MKSTLRLLMQSAMAPYCKLKSTIITSNANTMAAIGALNIADMAPALAQAKSNVISL